MQFLFLFLICAVQLYSLLHCFSCAVFFTASAVQSSSLLHFCFRTQPMKLLQGAFFFHCYFGDISLPQQKPQTIKTSQATNSKAHDMEFLPFILSEVLLRLVEDGAGQCTYCHLCVIGETQSTHRPFRDIGRNVALKHALFSSMIPHTKDLSRQRIYREEYALQIWNREGLIMGIRLDDTKMGYTGQGCLQLA